MSDLNSQILQEQKSDNRIEFSESLPGAQEKTRFKSRLNSVDFAESEKALKPQVNLTQKTESEQALA